MAATLNSMTVLCTGFQQKNLIGVTKDKEDHVLITCTGVVKRYNVIERRQIQSWTTKTWDPFTCAAVYNPINDSILTVTSDTKVTFRNCDIDNTTINTKATGYTFETPIHQLFVSEETIYILFSTGVLQEYSSAIKTCKETKVGFLQPSETIVYTKLLHQASVLVLIVQKEGPGKEKKLYKVEIGNTTPSLSHTLMLNNAYLTGYCVLSSAKLITLWSIGHLYSFDLESDYPDRLPGEKHASEKMVDVTQNTKILELSHSHIVIIGLDKEDEGGLMVLRDTKFGLCTSHRKLKMYLNPPLAWMVSGEGVVVAEGASLTYVPFTVQESNLATVFATRVADTEGSASEVCHSWVNNSDKHNIPEAATKSIYCNKSSELAQVIQSVDRGALSESLLAKAVVTKLIAKKNLRLIDEAISVFMDLPESSLIDALICYLGCKDMEFVGLKRVARLTYEIEPLEKDGETIICPFFSEKAHFVNGILNKSFTDVQLLAHLPRLSFSAALSLIRYLHYLIASGQAEFTKAGCDQNQTSILPLPLHIPGIEIMVEPMMPTLCQAGQWLGLLLDTNYHQLVMSSEVTVHRLLLSSFEYITNICKFLEGLADMETLTRQVVRGTPLSNKSSHTSAPYTLERLVFD